jgi:hypothetical protein
LCFASHSWQIALEQDEIVNEGSVAEKSWLICATVAAILALPPNPVQFARGESEVSR